MKKVVIEHHAYNQNLYNSVKTLGGTVENFSTFVIESDDELIIKKAEKLKQKWEKTKYVTIKFTESASTWRGPVSFCGYYIARAFGRDSGAYLGHGVQKLAGKVDSGGSQKNWTTYVSEGSVFRIQVAECCSLKKDGVIILTDEEAEKYLEDL